MQLHPLLFACILAGFSLGLHHSRGRKRYIPLKGTVIGYALDHYIRALLHRFHQQSAFVVRQYLNAANRACPVCHIKGIDGLSPVVQLLFLRFQFQPMSHIGTAQLLYLLIIRHNGHSVTSKTRFAHVGTPSDRIPRINRVIKDLHKLIQRQVIRHTVTPVILNL